MFAVVGRWVVRHSRGVLLACAMLTVLGGIASLGLFSRLSGGGFQIPSAESTLAARKLSETFGVGELDAVVLFRSDRLVADDPEFRRAVARALSGVPQTVAPVMITAWDGILPDLVSTDRRATAVVVRLAGDTDRVKVGSYHRLRSSVRAGDFQVGYGGLIPAIATAAEQSRRDLVRAELISLPLLVLVLIFVFRGVLAAALPVLAGAVTSVAALAALRFAVDLTDVSLFAVNAITLLALGMSVDYGLFVLVRFREERARCATVGDAVVVTMRTAGRTIFYSGLTVCLGLGGLMLLPISFAWSLGLGGVLAVALAMVVSLTLLPALLVLLDHRVLAGTWRGGTGAGWARVGRAVTRRPVRCVVGAILFLAVLSLPLLHISLGSPDQRTLPPGSPVRAATEALRHDFPNGELDRVLVVASGVDVPALQRDLALLPGVREARVVAERDATALVIVTHPGGPEHAASHDLVRRIRALSVPGNGTVLVGGLSAATVDVLDALSDRLPWIALVLCCSTFLLLFLAFGSVVVPVKAILTNLLSLGASLGAVVWIFQDGRLAGPLGFAPVGYLEVSQPVVTLMVAYGISMDYELFLLSRVRERYDLLGDNTAAIVAGLRDSGRIITCAALVLLVVVGSFATSGILAVKEIGIGLFVAIAIDATVVRIVLVPATLRLLGRANWWPSARPVAHEQVNVPSPRSHPTPARLPSQ